jgi:hypothetical protein
MDAGALIAAFTPKKILIQTSLLPLISVDPTAKTWLGDLLAPKIYAYIGESIIKIDPVAGASISSEEEVSAIPNNWGNMIALGVGVFFAVLIIKRIFHAR